VSDPAEYKPPARWVSAKLSDIATINPPLDRCFVSDDVPVDFVPMRAVEPEGGGLLRPEVASYGEVKKGYTAFLPGDVITAKITPCMENGKTCVVPPLPGAACFGSTEFHVLRAEPGIGARWIANYLLQHSTRHAAQRQMAGGVGQMRVPAAFLETLDLPVPPEPEQVRILDTLDELLSDLDAGLAALERVCAKLKHYRAAVLKAAVEGALTAEWRRQHPATEAADALLTRILAERRRRWEEAQLRKFEAAGKAPPKDWKAKYVEPGAPDSSSLPQLPKGWLWTSLGQCFSVRVGATPSRGRKDFWNGDIPWVASGEVQFCRIHKTRENITAQGLANSSTRLNPVGSVMLNMIGEGKTRGKAGILQIAACNNQNCAAIWVSETPIAPEYIYSWLLFRYEQTRELGSGNNQPAMNKSVVEEIAFPLLPLAEQEALVEAVEEQLSLIDHLERDLETRLTSAIALRQSILRYAFSGQLVPQDPNDEPASELLRRIAAEREERARLLRAAKQAKPKSKAPRRRATKE
jgi:type I restriction enzyme S subunit